MDTGVTDLIQGSERKLADILLTRVDNSSVAERISKQGLYYYCSTLKCSPTTRHNHGQPETMEKAEAAGDHDRGVEQHGRGWSGWCTGSGGGTRCLGQGAVNAGETMI